MEKNFEKLEYRFLENLMLFHLTFKRNLYEEAFSDVKTKTMPHFAVKVFSKKQPLIFIVTWSITLICTQWNYKCFISRVNKHQKQPRFFFLTKFCFELFLKFFPTCILLVSLSVGRWAVSDVSLSTWWFYS